MNTLQDNVLVKASIHPAAMTSDTNGTGVDTKGYDQALMVVHAGAVVGDDGDETYSVKIQESSDNGSSDAFADVSGASVSIARDGDNGVYTFQLNGISTSRERYLRAVVDVGGTTPSIIASVDFLLGSPVYAPVTQDN